MADLIFRSLFFGTFVFVLFWLHIHTDWGWKRLTEWRKDVELLEQFHTYSAPDRDPRGPVISTVFLARANGVPKAADDAKNVWMFREGSLPPMAFDHTKILEDYFTYARYGIRPGFDH